MKNIFLFFLIFCCLSVNAQQYPDRHNTTVENSWLSCVATANPNPVRGNSHWIRYDLNTTYALHQSKFWNVNAYQHTNEGAQDIEIDYSIDGVTWKNWGRYSLSQASGSSTYEGEAGPNFNGLIARHILITITSNHGGACRGLSEFKVESSPVTVSSDDLAELASDQISAFPNPFGDILTISLDENISIGDQAYYQLYDMKGSLILQNNITNSDFIIKGDALVSGAYQVKVFTASGYRTLTVNHLK